MELIVCGVADRCEAPLGKIPGEAWVWGGGERMWLLWTWAPSRRLPVPRGAWLWKTNLWRERVG